MLPEEFLKRMARLLGPEYEAFLASYDKPSMPGLRQNLLRKRDLPLPYVSEPVPWAPGGYYYDPANRPGLDPRHDAGLYYLQEPSAMAPAALLAPLPGERVLDLCGAPGGKSTQLASFLRGEGLLVSNEIVFSRAKILSQNIERMGIANALVLSEHPAKLASRFPGYFDKIMVDAPCSGEGMFRKEEAALRDWSPEQVLICARRQREILESAGEMLKPGGRMVYSTCTFAPEENEGVLSDFLRAHPDFSLAEIPAPWFSPGRPDAVPEPAEGLEKAFRLFPHKLNGLGHFAAVLQRKGEAVPEKEKAASGEKCPPELRDFLRDMKITLPAGRLLSFGETLYLLPEPAPDLKGLKVLRPGLCLGIPKKGRFEPDHALALWADCSAPSKDFAPEDPALSSYLRGEAIIGEESGWKRITVEGSPLGWVKGSNGMLKNHLPKGLRRY